MESSQQNRKIESFSIHIQCRWQTNLAKKARASWKAKRLQRKTVNLQVRQAQKRVNPQHLPREDEASLRSNPPKDIILANPETTPVNKRPEVEDHRGHPHKAQESKITESQNPSKREAAVRDNKEPNQHRREEVNSPEEYGQQMANVQQKSRTQQKFHVHYAQSIQQRLLIYHCWIFIP